MKKIFILLSCIFLFSCQWWSQPQVTSGIQFSDEKDQDVLLFPYENQNVIQIQHQKSEIKPTETLQLTLSSSDNSAKFSSVNVTLGDEIISNNYFDFFQNYSTDVKYALHIAAEIPKHQKAQLQLEYSTPNDKERKIGVQAHVKDLLGRTIADRYDGFASFASSQWLWIDFDATKISDNVISHIFLRDDAVIPSSLGLMLDISGISDKIDGSSNGAIFSVNFPLSYQKFVTYTPEEIEFKKSRYYSVLHEKEMTTLTAKEKELWESIAKKQREEEEQNALWKQNLFVKIHYKNGKNEKIPLSKDISKDEKWMHFSFYEDVFRMHFVDKDKLSQIAKIEIASDKNFPQNMTTSELAAFTGSFAHPLIATNSETDKQGINYRQKAIFSPPQIPFDPEALIFSANITPGQTLPRILSYRASITREEGIKQDISINGDAVVNVFFALPKVTQQGIIGVAESGRNFLKTFPLGRVRYQLLSQYVHSVLGYEVLLSKIAQWWYHMQFLVQSDENNRYSSLSYKIPFAQDLSSVVHSQKVVFDISQIKQYISSYSETFERVPLHFSVENFYPKKYSHYRVFLINKNGNRNEITQSKYVSHLSKTRASYKLFDSIESAFVYVHFEDSHEISDVQAIEVLFLE